MADKFRRFTFKRDGWREKRYCSNLPAARGFQRPAAAGSMNVDTLTPGVSNHLLKEGQRAKLFSKWQIMVPKVPDQNRGAGTSGRA